MICPFCLMEIENDSAFCDQCGEELYVCPDCGKLGKKGLCEIDKIKLVSIANSGNVIVNPNRISPVGKTTASSKPKEKLTKLFIINNNLNVNVELLNDDIIGRKVDKFSSVLNNQKQISGNHAKVNFNSNSGWSICDLDSSNGTEYNGEKLNPFKSVKLKTDTHITLANIEFYILIK